MIPNFFCKHWKTFVIGFGLSLSARVSQGQNDRLVVHRPECLESCWKHSFPLAHDQVSEAASIAARAPNCVLWRSTVWPAVCRGTFSLYLWNDSFVMFFHRSMGLPHRYNRLCQLHGSDFSSTRLDNSVPTWMLAALHGSRSWTCPLDRFLQHVTAHLHWISPRLARTTMINLWGEFSPSSELQSHRKFQILRSVMPRLRVAAE